PTETVAGWRTSVSARGDDGVADLRRPDVGACHAARLMEEDVGSLPLVEGGCSWATSPIATIVVRGIAAAPARVGERAGDLLRGARVGAAGRAAGRRPAGDGARS